MEERIIYMEKVKKKLSEFGIEGKGCAYYHKHECILGRLV